MQRNLPALSAWGLACSLAASSAAGCDAETAPPRGQIVLFVDTNLPLPSHVIEDPHLAAAAVDTLRVDVLGEDDCGEVREIVVPEAADWPISFGIAAPEGGGMVALRLRLFRAGLAEQEVKCTQTASLPPPTMTVERVIRLHAPASAVERVRVVLDGGCYNHRSRFAEGDWATCIDAERPGAAPEEGIERFERVAPPSEVGTWAGAVTMPCTGLGRQGAVCIAGGFTQLGDSALVGLASASEYRDPLPLRPVVVSPFWMDAEEISVGDYGEIPEPPPAIEHDPDHVYFRFCNWSSSAALPPEMPMNCISNDSARAVCEKRGGRLPSEAEWEHAARGRGRGWTFPWGNAQADACIASVARAGVGTEPVGSHPAGICAVGEQALGDETPDGVLDLAGSVAEHVRDHLAPYDQGCWDVAGVAHDPTCVSAEAAVAGSRGGDWEASGSLAASALRREQLTPGPRVGFRCVYEDAP